MRQRWEAGLFLVWSAAAVAVLVPVFWLVGLWIGGVLQVEPAIYPVMALLAVLGLGGIALAGTRALLYRGLSRLPAAVLGAAGPVAGLVVGCLYWDTAYALVEWAPVTIPAVLAAGAGAVLALRRRAVAPAPAR
ncbi:hypothetical protein GCM10010413_44940 [Promicromonospora sukumoe]|uniref:Uncharacterized protein n=1 Tax=Promicromonospora sukumoe TaxID=88382 RepID=A0A7W3JC12_9MICO|nr:hypothetical protein [Promicromonospora sukumoe]MBA8810062.1 hypothetical protein [Promicromonospora sukumoe]